MVKKKLKAKTKKAKKSAPKKPVVKKSKNVCEFC